MIRLLRCNKPSFRSVAFVEGLNVVLADRTKEETKRQSRNGLGKSTLIEIIHFCLGADFKGPLTAPSLVGWIFTMDMVLLGKEISVSRDTSAASKVTIVGDTRNWPVQPRENKTTGTFELPYREWAQVLGAMAFALPIDQSGKYRPTYRSLISYFIRRGRDAYSTPFEFMRKQSPWSIQVLNCFLLGLDVQDAIDFQKLKDRKETLLQLRKLATGADTMKEILGSLAEYEAQKVRLEGHVKRQTQELLDFKVHPQYEDISIEADDLTAELHDWTNENVVDRRLINLYEQTLVEEVAPQSEQVLELYTKAGVELPGVVVKRLEDVQAFHLALVENRKSFLNSEIQRLRRAIEQRKTKIESITAKRADLMSILRTHGALEEHNKLQQRDLKTRAELQLVLERIKTIREVQEGESALKIERELLVQKARRGLDERAKDRDLAIELFNSNAQALYDTAGNLLIEIRESGFNFKVAFERSSSGGVGNMKIFCYDMTVSQIWSQRTNRPGFLVHDSIIWDGVDERQRAKALERAAAVSSTLGFQYICTMNSDAIPRADFDAEFSFDSYVRLRLSDESDETRLMGIRFEVDEDLLDQPSAGLEQAELSA